MERKKYFMAHATYATHTTHKPTLPTLFSRLSLCIDDIEVDFAV